ncbi:MAG: 2-dehydro-3-deoxy-6-phosphogalactonate aldolase [Candidimonas sp.]|nr:MAG: 2-dehydro-3-deoxy-6-phosphogalactonate aldolase [Candidimonas sp.]
MRTAGPRGTLEELLKPLPLIAILRGIRKQEAVAVGRALHDAGFRIIEIPLNSPEPFESIRLLAESMPHDCLVGAGTVTATAQIAAVEAAGGQLIVMPHSDTAIIAAAKARQMVCLPGVATITEAFAALAAGADGLKLFPANVLTPATLVAWRAVLPREVITLPVGGVHPDNLAAWAAAGARGFGIGSALYKPGASASETNERGRAFAQAWAAISGSTTPSSTRGPGTHG